MASVLPACAHEGADCNDHGGGQAPEEEAAVPGLQIAKHREGQHEAEQDEDPDEGDPQGIGAVHGCFDVVGCRIVDWVVRLWTVEQLLKAGQSCGFVCPVTQKPPP